MRAAFIEARWEAFGAGTKTVAKSELRPLLCVRIVGRVNSGDFNRTGMQAKRVFNQPAVVSIGLVMSTGWCALVGYTIFRLVSVAL